MIGRLPVVVDIRPQPWIFQMLQALHSAGVSTCVSTKPVRGRSLDLRSRRRVGDNARGWRLEIGTHRGAIPAFEEGKNGAHALVARLVAFTGDRQLVVRSGRFPYARSHARTIALVVRQAARWIADEQEHPTPDAHCTDTALALHAGSPMPWEWLLFAGREIARFAHYALRFLFEEARWDVAVTNTSVGAFVDEPTDVWLHWLARNNAEFLADPFFDGHGERARLLCETLDAGIPCIVAIDLDDRFGARKPLSLGEGPASYPYVCAVDGETWLIPEQRVRRSIYAYRLNGSVERIEEPIHAGIAAVDSTIVQHDGRWWLFCADADDAPNYALRIFWAQQPRGPWTPHARNPAKIDVGGSRPAGNFFVRDGTLYRPAQDCTGRYGRAVVIQRIDVLTPDEFVETSVARLDASNVQRKGAVGVHTLSHGAGWVAIDAQFLRWSLRKPLRLLRGELA